MSAEPPAWGDPEVLHGIITHVGNCLIRVVCALGQADARLALYGMPPVSNVAERFRTLCTIEGVPPSEEMMEDLLQAYVAGQEMVRAERYRSPN